MAKFKVGDLIRVVEDDYFSRNNGCIYRIIEYGESDGRDYRAELVKGSGATVAGTNYQYFNDNEIEGVAKTMKDLQQGDVVTDGDVELTIHGKIGDVYVTTKGHRQEGYLYSVKELEDEEFQLKDESLKELTLEQVADLAGVDVSKIRIKE